MLYTDGLDRIDWIARPRRRGDAGGRRLLTDGRSRKAARRRHGRLAFAGRPRDAGAALFRGICAAHGYTPKGTTHVYILHEIDNE